MTVSETALHGVVKLPVAVQVRLKDVLASVILGPIDTTIPSLSVHW